MNKAVIRFLEKAVGKPVPSRGSPLQKDLDHFSGIWSAEEAEDMNKLLSGLRTTDEELWK